ncbi:MAG: SRPBCC family protein [Actinomycetota bacterium]
MTETVVHRGRAAAAPAEVWRVLGDYFALATWAGAIDHSSAMTATPAGLDASRRVALGSTVLIENVVAWEPGQEMAYEIVGLPPLIRRAENRWRLAADGDGTSVELTATIEPGPRPPMKIAAKAVARRVGATNRSLVDDLVNAAERQSA